ncbi:GNAT family N-acetyltransferase [Catalinimonas niigatensis]|uniref:GNAT family N-acetyltransferase n=1 Tax=Catalinimonas niigatensis TaxID=1397264 RepID=UPI0026660E6A|nr:GNAT family N-acetyltransferase [Catalinimonas niigatensis]WPP53697.1 GNAT family N-acetyltransferase [Catalinimonas niigatensis]
MDGKPIGLLKLNRQPNNIEIIQIQIDPQYQGKGIGQKVIQFILDQASDKQISVSLSVLKGNKAKRLYESLEFVTIEETEDSFVMRI